MTLPEHRRLQHAAVRTEGAAQRALFAGECAAARERFAEAVALYRSSYALAPPGATGRLIGMLKAAVLAGRETADAVAWARDRLAEEDGGDPPHAYALALCDLIEEADAAALDHTPSMRPGTPAFGRTADAIEALALRRDGAYAKAVGAIVRDFEQRRHHVTKVPIADTALMLEAFAAPRGLAAHPRSPLLPPPCDG